MLVYVRLLCLLLFLVCLCLCWLSFRRVYSSCDAWIGWFIYRRTRNARTSSIHHVSRMSARAQCECAWRVSGCVVSPAPHAQLPMFPKNLWRGSWALCNSRTLAIIKPIADAFQDVLVSSLMGRTSNEISSGSSSNSSSSIVIGAHVERDLGLVVQQELDLSGGDVLERVALSL